MMTRKPFGLALTAGVLSLLLGTGGLYAQGSEKHPAYLQALSNLKLARALLEKTPSTQKLDGKEAAALAEIDATIGDLNKASVVGGKPALSPRVSDAKLDRTKRFREALKLLAMARKEIKEEKTEPATGLKVRSEKHLKKASRLVDDEIRHLT